MRKSVDIDALLAEDQLILMLGGETYTLKDVSIAAFMMTTNEEPSGDVLHKQLALILKVDQEKLSGIGLKAAALTIKAIRDWVTESSFAEETANTKAVSVNP